jgi:putative oxidoreductase
MKVGSIRANTRSSAATDAGRLLLRGSFGSLMAGHGAQKLFGWFGGHGLNGTSMWLESMGFKPGKPWAVAAGASEFGGGVLTELGLLHPLGPLLTLGSMGIATFKVHWGKPIWVTSGGAELPVLNMAIVSALLLSGPGRYSLDNLLNIRLPRWLAIPGGALAAAGVAYGVFISQANQAAEQAQTQEAAAAGQAQQQEQATQEQETITR